MRWFVKCGKFVVMAAVILTVVGFVTEHLWNALMPQIFGLRTIGFWQAVGLMLLGKLLFGGFHKHVGGRGWKRHMEERWAHMTPEERERFRVGMRMKWRGGSCGFKGRWPGEEFREGQADDANGGPAKEAAER